MTNVQAIELAILRRLEMAIEKQIEEEYRGNVPPRDAVRQSDGTYKDRDGQRWIQDIGGWRPDY